MSEAREQFKQILRDSIIDLRGLEMGVESISDEAADSIGQAAGCLESALDELNNDSINGDE